MGDDAMDTGETRSLKTKRPNEMQSCKNKKPRTDPDRSKEQTASNSTTHSTNNINTNSTNTINTNTHQTNDNNSTNPITNNTTDTDITPPNDEMLYMENDKGPDFFVMMEKENLNEITTGQLLKKMEIKSIKEIRKVGKNRIRVTMTDKKDANKLIHTFFRPASSAMCQQICPLMNS